jgi:hypothetical protein
MQIDRSLSTLVTVAVPVASPPGQAPDARADRAERLPTELAAALARPTWLSGPRVQAGLLVLAPMLLLLFARYFVSSTDPDYWWHVRTGQYIVETGTLPRAEIYSYTVPDRPWVTHEWLAEVLLYVVQQRFGYVGNVVLFAALAALTALVVYATCRVRGLGEPSAAMLMLWAVGIGMGSANVRPQLLTTLMLAVCALLLTLYLRGQTRAIWPYPLLMALWVNLHGGYVIGLVLLGLTVVGQGVAWVLGRPVAPLRPLVLIALLSGMATLISPHGLEAIWYPFTYVGSENPSMRYIAEWQSVDFHRSGSLIFAGSVLLAIVLGVGRRPLGPTEALWVVALALMALQSVRHLALYGVVAIPLLAARLQAEIPMLRGTLATWRRPKLLVVIWPLVAILLLRLAFVGGGWEHAQVGREPTARTYPAGAVDYLRTHDLPGNLFSSYHWGGYLIYELYPERSVFIDGRMDLYDDVIVPYLKVMGLNPGWRHVLDEYDVRLILVEKDGPLAVVLADDPSWQLAFTGDVERLYVRR